MLDTLDNKILTTLVNNARITWSELASLLKLSGPSTADRVRRLEEKKIIKGYITLIDHKAIGYTLLAYVFVTLGHPNSRAVFLKTAQELSEVLECHHITGDDDYLLKVRCKDTDHLDQFLNDHLKQIAGVIKTRTTIVLSSAKENSSVLIKTNGGKYVD